MIFWYGGSLGGWFGCWCGDGVLFACGSLFGLVCIGSGWCGVMWFGVV